VGLLACGVNEQQRQYIDKIDSLQTVLDSAENQYLSLDTNKLFQSFDVLNANLARLQTIDTVLSDTVKIYAFMQKTFRRFIEDHREIMVEISYSKDQLATLKKDIRKGRLPEDLMQEYYHTEEEALGMLTHKMWFNSESVAHQLQSFDHLNEHIEGIIHRHEQNQ
jgi:hypothetical protein